MATYLRNENSRKCLFFTGLQSLLERMFSADLLIFPIIISRVIIELIHFYIFRFFLKKYT